jgi:hypothetical protein
VTIDYSPLNPEFHTFVALPIQTPNLIINQAIQNPLMIFEEIDKMKSLTLTSFESYIPTKFSNIESLSIK